MAAPLRSKQGCWTCKLRRKKCDETRPNCSICKSLGITCHGYGPKPEWMDNGDKERAVTNSLKEIVKQTTRRKGAAQVPKKRHKVINIAPKSSDDSQKDSETPVSDLQQSDASPPVDYVSSQQFKHGIEERGSAKPPSLERDDSISRTHFSISTEESVLLMHYLDFIFPLQYPMFKPGILEGGRGWLLKLLLESSALYHVALAFSVYHRRQVMPVDTSHAVQAAALIQQETYLGVSIKLVNQAVHEQCGTWVPTTIVQLMFFELFGDNTSGWQAHLRALLNISFQAYKKNFNERLDQTEPVKQVLHKDQPISNQTALVAEEMGNFQFVCSTMVWLDIVSSITTGKAPVLLNYHSIILASNSQVRCGDIMGCKNFLMLQIGRIAAQHEKKALAVNEGRFECTQFKQEAIDIVQEIRRGLAEEALEDLNLSKPDSTLLQNIMSDPQMLVTRIFARMALVYLHLVAHGFENSEMLNTALSEAMEMIQTVPKHLLSALVLPLFIIGAMARLEDQQFFRDVLSSSPLRNPMLKHRARLLPILEEIWRQRQSMEWPLLGWNDCVQLTHDILLL